MLFLRRTNGRYQVIHAKGREETVLSKHRTMNDAIAYVDALEKPDKVLRRSLSVRNNLGASG